MTKAEDEVYQMIFTNGKQILSPEMNSVNFHATTHEDTEILGAFCDFTAIRGEKLKLTLIRGYLKSNPQAEFQGDWRRILIRNNKGGYIGARMLCPVCNKDNGQDEYMKYCPNCGSRLRDYVKNEEE